MSAITPVGRSAPAFRLGKIYVEDLTPALFYVTLTWVFHAAGMDDLTLSQFQGYSTWWPVPLVLGCLAIIFRRINVPLAAIVMAISGIALFSLGSTGGFFLIFEAVFTLVLLASPRVSRFTEHGALVTTGLLVVLMYFVTGSPALTVTTGLVTGATVWMPAEWAGNVRKARDLAMSEKQTADAIAQAAWAQSQTQAAEHEVLLAQVRTSMAREVHDVLSARLSAIALQSGAALNAPENSILASRAMEEIRAQSVKGIEELNAMIRMLHRGTPVAPAGTIADITALIETFTGAGKRVTYENALPHNGRDLPAPVQAALYRAVNEALINFAKHAPTSELCVAMELIDGAVEFTATNPLQDSATVQMETTTISGTGTGLRSMRARSTELGGRFHAGTLGNQFVLTMLLPVEDPRH